MNDKEKRRLELRSKIERSLRNMERLASEITTKPRSRFTCWRPGQRVMRPDLADGDFTGTDVHDISDMAKAAFIANVAIARMMQC